jgi:hypothetical protein
LNDAGKRRGLNRHSAAEVRLHETIRSIEPDEQPYLHTGQSEGIQHGIDLVPKASRKARYPRRYRTVQLIDGEAAQSARCHSAASFVAR